MCNNRQAKAVPDISAATFEQPNIGLSQFCQPLSRLSAEPSRSIRSFIIRSSATHDESYPLFFFLSSRQHCGQVGGQVCPLIQNDKFPPEPVAWRHWLSRLDTGDSVISEPGKGHTWCSGAMTEASALQHIVKLFVYEGRCFIFIMCGITCQQEG